mgnify:CR=1 FL=1
MKKILAIFMTFCLFLPSFFFSNYKQVDAKEIYNYDLDHWESGKMIPSYLDDGDDNIYYKFKLKKKTKIKIVYQYKSKVGYGPDLCNATGKKIYKRSKLKFKKNTITGWRKSTYKKTLKKGTYYLHLHNNGRWGINPWSYKFKISIL